MKRLLFIPCYNCEKQIIRVLKQLDQDQRRYFDKVMLVNNRSLDNTESVAMDYAKKDGELPILVVRNCENYGLGGSHKVAFDYAIKNNYDEVVVFHGDDQGTIRDVTRVIDQGLDPGIDCYLGARFHSQSTLVGYSKFRTLGNQVYNLLFSLFVKYHVKDLGSGLNLYRTSMLENGFYKKFPDDLTFNYCMVMASDYYKHKVKFFPIMWREEDQVSNVKLFSQAKKVLHMLLKYGLNKKQFMMEQLCIERDDYPYEVIYEREAND